MKRYKKIFVILLLVLMSLEILGATTLAKNKNSKHAVIINTGSAANTSPTMTVDEYCKINNITSSTNLTNKQAYSIIFLYHNIPLDYYYTDIRTLKWNCPSKMTREYALKAVIESFGVVPYNEPDHIWSDEYYHNMACDDYIDMAYRLGITYGVGNNTFMPKGNVTKDILLAFLDRANNIKDTLEKEILFPIECSDNYTKFLSSSILSAIYLMPEYVWKDFIKSGWTYRFTQYPCDAIIPGNDSNEVIGYEHFGKKLCSQIAWGKDHKYVNVRSTIIHEFGHFVDDTTSTNLSSKTIENEINNLITLQGDYCKTNNYEYFAEAYEVYIFGGEKLRSYLPLTYATIDNSLSQISLRYK